MNTDQEWALGLFERSRQGEEPMWVADHTAMIRAGRRRNRIRTLTASGSVVAAAAVVAAVGIGVSGSASRKEPGPAPGQSAPPPTRPPVAVDPSKVLDYVDFLSYAPRNTANLGASANELAVSASTARDAMELLSKLDPSLTHVARNAPDGGFAKLVADNDPKAANETMVTANVLWTEDGQPAAALRATGATARTGTLTLSFTDASAEGPDGGPACATSAEVADLLVHPVQTPGGGWTDAAAWSPCTTSTLPDGSELITATKTYGPLSVLSVIRKFPGNGGELTAEWQNFPTSAPGLQGGQPSPDQKRTLSQNPINLEMLQAALSDTKLVPPLPPAPGL